MITAAQLTDLLNHPATVLTLGPIIALSLPAVAIIATQAVARLARVGDGDV